MPDTIEQGAQRFRRSSEADMGLEERPFKTLSREEAQVLRARLPQVSPWRVVAMQAVVGLVCGAVAGWITGRSGVAWSALYGAACVVLPSALLARGMTRKVHRQAAVAAAFGFMFWELVKIGVAVAMLAAAPRVVPELNWPALLVAMLVCVKVNWWALLWRRAPVKTKTT
jgi:ATP synthase protein I